MVMKSFPVFFTKDRMYKTVVSVLFGMIGFIVNFHTIIFPFGHYTVAILFGLLFPLLITLSWGWKYGLLSALAGGTQAMWWLWGATNGYALFFVVPPFTLWIVWHGYMAEKRSRESHKWWFNLYLWEIPFRLLNTVNILTVTRWAVSQNPPEWSWALNAPSTIPLEFSVFVAIKQAVVAYLLLLCTDVLLNLSFVRKFFMLKSISDKVNTAYIISIALLVGAFYWFLDSLIYTFLGKGESGFIDYFASQVPQTNLMSRIVFIICILVAGLITAKLIYRKRLNEIILRKMRKESTNREALLSSVIKAIPDLVWLKDKEGVYLACNPRFEDFFGAREEEIVGRTDYDFVSRELADFFRVHDKNAMINREPCVNEEEIIFASDGHRELLETTKTPMYNNKGELIGILGIGHNITEKKLLQDQLSQSQRMESVGRLAGGVAHDFNNMLSIILGNSELILFTQPDDSKFSEPLMEIRDAAVRSSELTKQLLAFARRQAISPRKMDLNIAVEGVLKMLRRLIGEDIELIWRPGENIWPVKMDAGQIDQVLANMCVNARDSIKNIGTIIIETKNVTVDENYCAEHSYFKPQDYVMMTVSDTGLGMTRETQEHIFEPFYTTKESGKGTGLGLATVYGIIKQNHGFINVYSELKIGTTFKLFFPRFLGSGEGNTSEEENQAILCGNETIILVEDESVILKITKIKLEQLGYTVYAYSNPLTAIKASKDIEHVDLLITDVIMPEMNGKDLMREILSVHREIETLFMSGYTADVIADHGILNRGVNFISKPFTTRDLSIKVRRALDE